MCARGDVARQRFTNNVSTYCCDVSHFMLFRSQVSIRIWLLKVLPHLSSTSRIACHSWQSARPSPCMEGSRERAVEGPMPCFLFFCQLTFIIKVNKVPYMLLLVFNPRHGFYHVSREKRKITGGGREFHEKWTGDSFLVKANKTRCWLCREFVQVFKECNLKRRYVQKHAVKLNVYEGLCHKGKIAELEKSVFSTKIFSESYTLGEFHSL